MSNRFVQRIRSGEIESVEDLKTAFRELALATHPDVAATHSDSAPNGIGAGGGGPRAAGRGIDPGGAFIAVRAEYEAALVNFERHRFGARRIDGEGRPSGGGAAVEAAELWSCLSLMLKRGFPKEPRHEKETLRYEYARWRLCGALDSLAREKGGGDIDGERSASRLFGDFEASLLDLKKTAPGLLASSLAYLRGLVDFASRNLPAMRTDLVRGFESLRCDARLAPGAREFLLVLSTELGIGPTLNPYAGPSA